jgi:hypothetical protein
MARTAMPVSWISFDALTRWPLTHRSALPPSRNSSRLAPEPFAFRHSIRSRVTVSLPQTRRNKETARLHALGLGLRPRHASHREGGEVGDMHAQGA